LYNNDGTLHEDRCTFLIISRSVLRMKNVSDKNCRETRNTHFIFNNSFRKSCRLSYNVGKHCVAGQATGENMAQAHCMLDTEGYKYTHRLYNTHCFSSATMAARTRLTITLYVHCSLSCSCEVWQNTYKPQKLKGLMNSVPMNSYCNALQPVISYKYMAV
jgi:hypothetical protein